MGRAFSVEAESVLALWRREHPWSRKQDPGDLGQRKDCRFTLTHRGRPSFHYISGTWRRMARVH